jgi:hypothetical protein
MSQDDVLKTMNLKRIAVFSVVGGVLMTLATGLVSSTPHMLVGAMWYGYPLAWLFRLILAPEYFPWRVDMTALLVDIIAWSVVAAIVLMVLKRISG